MASHLVFYDVHFVLCYNMLYTISLVVYKFDDMIFIYFHIMHEIYLITSIINLIVSITIATGLAEFYIYQLNIQLLCWVKKMA